MQTRENAVSAFDESGLPALDLAFHGGPVHDAFEPSKSPDIVISSDSLKLFPAGYEGPHRRPPVPAFFHPALARPALHEIYAATQADASAATGFALALACRIKRAYPLIWVRQDFLDSEAGFPNPPGLAEFGLDPAAIIRVSARDARTALQAGLEAVRCRSTGMAFIELWGETRAFDLTASRRLALAAKASGVTVLLARCAATQQPSAAETRWRVGAAPSRARITGEPGGPAFSVRLLRDRGGMAGKEWRLEWNRDARCFEDRTAVHASTS